MKIAFSARGPGPEFDLDENFGRAYWLLVYDRQTGKWAALDNRENRDALENAGLRAAQLLLDCGVDALVSGKVGPRVFRLLQSHGVKIYFAAAESVAEILTRWMSRSLPLAMAANSQGSPYCLVAQPLTEQKRVNNVAGPLRTVGDKT